ncbi:hypothetical protein KP509_05G036300 [Ceratopteris richardii]|nr:hypothetical protein KP509_05G036300 [Ceratopteris richardii]
MVEGTHGRSQKDLYGPAAKADIAFKQRYADADVALRLASLGLDRVDESEAPALGPKIVGWDEKRQALLSRNTAQAGGRSLRHKILLVTGSSSKPCKNAFGDHILLQFTKNKMDYCRLHGIDFFYSMALLNPGMDDCWSKLPVIRKLMLSHPEVEWIWWMDSNAAFTDMTFKLPMERYAQYNLVLHGWDDDIYLKKSWVGLNAGVFLIRNCQWSLDLMDAWARMGKDKQLRERLGPFFSEILVSRPAFEGDDQASLIFILNNQKEIWESKVYFENSFYLHGHWGLLVGNYEKLMQSSHPGYGDDRWPFVTHFVGCEPCGPQSLEGSTCLKQMERAFNFADNQVLHFYGFEHIDLNKFEVGPVGNKST